MAQEVLLFSDTASPSSVDGVVPELSFRRVGSLAAAVQGTTQALALIVGLDQEGPLLKEFVEGELDPACPIFFHTRPEVFPDLINALKSSPASPLWHSLVGVRIGARVPFGMMDSTLKALRERSLISQTSGFSPRPNLLGLRLRVKEEWPFQLIKTSSPQPLTMRGEPLNCSTPFLVDRRTR